MGKDRLCIDPGVVKRSDGRAICPAMFYSRRQNGCEGCPKSGGFNSEVGGTQVPELEKIASDVINQIRRNGISQAAQRHRRNYLSRS